MPAKSIGGMVLQSDANRQEVVPQKKQTAAQAPYAAIFPFLPLLTLLSRSQASAMSL